MLKFEVFVKNDFFDSLDAESIMNVELLQGCATVARVFNPRSSGARTLKSTISYR